MQSTLNRVSSLFIFLFLSAGAFAQTRVITSVGGNGTAGFGGDGGPATSAILNGPSEVTIDSAGNFYIADRRNNRIRRVDIRTGVITTVAGSGVAGWYFEGGPAIFSSLDNPSGVAVDAAGNLYIADLLDTGISRIHKVTAATGTINKLEIPIVLNGAVDIALDSAGNLYIAEEIGHRIHKVALNTGIITTVAGIGAPGFSGDGGPAIAAHINGPVHLAISSAGDLYFSDSLNNRIRKVTAATGIITTVAGSGASGGPGGFGGDGGSATSALLNNPRGVAIDSAGDLLIADTVNKRIRKVSAKTGVITTIAAGQQTGNCPGANSFLKSPGSIAVNASGNFIYVADDDGNRVWKVTLDLNTPAPALTSIAPSSGVPGAIVAATLAGTGLAGGTGPTGSDCGFVAQTVFVSGTGVTVSNVNAASDSALAVTFTIAPDAALGPRDVTVTTDGGTSASLPFTVAAQRPPVPTLASVTPAITMRGTTAILTLTGTNFAPGSTAVLVDGKGISPGDVRVTNAASLTAVFTTNPDTTLGNHNVTVVTAGGSSNAVPLTVQPQGPAFTYGIPPILNPTDQAPIQVALASPLPDTVTGKLTLTFIPNASTNTDDPNVMFINSQTSTRTVDVTFSANTPTAQLSLPSGILQAGTVAGTIRLTMTDVQVGGVNVTPADSAFDVEVPRLVPVITDVRVLNRSSSGFDVEVTGYSDSRDITAATFSFGAATGAHLLTVQLQPDVASPFNVYYQSPSSGTVGSAFVYTQPFIVKQGNAKAVASVTVTLANGQGTSEPKTAR